MRFVEWGDAANSRVLVCVHGLTRNGRDFDYVAERLADAYRVVCPDIVGRGRSDWLRDPAEYNYPVYCADLTTLIAKLGVETVDWLGTSMGGIIGMIMASLHAETVDWIGTSMGGILGMMLASLPGSPLRKLVLNDVGAVIPAAAIERIGQYVGAEPVFESLDALEAGMRSVSPFGELSADQWRHLALHVARRDDEGRWRFCYDPGIARNFHAAPKGDVDLRPYWKRVPGPALVLRGDSSDLLLPATLEEMCRRPHTQSHIVARTGHAPMLMDDAQVGVVRHFLLG